MSLLCEQGWLDMGHEITKQTTASKAWFPLKPVVAAIALLLVAVCAGAAPALFLGALLVPATFAGALVALYTAAMARDKDVTTLRRLIGFVLLLVGVVVLAFGAVFSGALMGDKLLAMSRNKQYFWSWPLEYNVGFAFWLGAPTLLMVGMRLRKRMTPRQITWTWLYWFAYFPATMLLTIFGVEVLNQPLST